MKKIGIWLLLAALALSGVAHAEEKTHMLWEIPFGSSIYECQALAMKNAGVELEEIYEDYAGRVLLLKEGQMPRIWGRPVKMMRFMFTDYALSRIVVEFYRERPKGLAAQRYETEEEKKEFLQNEVRFYDTLLNDIAHEYDTELSGGDLTLGYYYEYDFPLWEGAFNAELLVEQALAGEDCAVRARYDNIVAYINVYEWWNNPTEPYHVTLLMNLYDTPQEPLTPKGQLGEYPYVAPEPTRRIGSPMPTAAPEATEEPAS